MISMGLSDWKKKLFNMDIGISKITIQNKKRVHLPQNTFVPTPTPIESKLIRILNVKTLGSEIMDILKPTTNTLEGLSPSDYQNKLENIISKLQELKQNEKRKILNLLHQDAIHVLQAESSRNELLEELRIMLLQG